MTAEANNSDIESLKSHLGSMEKTHDLKYAPIEALSNIKTTIAAHEEKFKNWNCRFDDHISSSKYFSGTVISIVCMCATVILAMMAIIKTVENDSVLTKIQTNEKMILSKLNS